MEALESVSSMKKRKEGKEGEREQERKEGQKEGVTKMVLEKLDINMLCLGESNQAAFPSPKTDLRFLNEHQMRLDLYQGTVFCGKRVC